ncbi:putative gamma-glutamylcyclotransferase CG2811 isoform X3 [Drosophila miranda]|nr:putative gamma-glutamylcyclotransferase CG2811 isoform X3 [Drosophila miranda]
MFSKLDQLEDYPNYYDREEQTIRTETEGNLQCWLYLIRNFPVKMLAKPQLSAYHNTPEQPYSEKSVRDPAISAKDDLSY